MPTPDAPPPRARLAAVVARFAELPDDAATLAADVLAVIARHYAARAAAPDLPTTPDARRDAPPTDASAP